MSNNNNYMLSYPLCFKIELQTNKRKETHNASTTASPDKQECVTRDVKVYDELHLELMRQRLQHCPRVCYCNRIGKHAVKKKEKKRNDK